MDTTKKSDSTGSGLLEKYSYLVALVVPIVIVIGTFFTLQADFRHLESRLSTDEQVISNQFLDLENRTRTLELDTSSRLATIETRLLSIEQYMFEITVFVRQATQGSLSEAGLPNVSSPSR